LNTTEGQASNQTVFSFALMQHGVAFLLMTLLTLSSQVQCAVSSTAERSEEPRNMPLFVQDELIVVFRESTSELRAKEIHQSLNVSSFRLIRNGHNYLIRLPKDKTLEETRQAYLAFPEVKTAEPNYRIHAL
jgi:hypothetical protein